MKKILLLILVFWSAIVYAQPAKVPGYNEFNEKRNQLALIARQLNIPIMATPALGTGQPGLAGALIIDTTGGNKGLHGYWDGAWHRIVDTTQSFAQLAANGTSVSSNTVVLGGSTISQYTGIGISGFPLSVVGNGVRNSTQSDSNSLRLINNSIPTLATDSFVSPRIIYGVTARRTFPSGLNQQINFAWDAIANANGSAGNALFRLRTNTNSAAYTTIFSINSTGIITSPLNLGGASLGAVPTSNNTWFGSTALNALSSGLRNVAIGDNTLKLHSTGDDNTAIGANAMANENTTSFNTAVGAYALNANTTGEQNTAIGRGALLVNTIAIKNTAVGAGAMEGTTTGGFNTGLGHDALLRNTIGTDNIGVGWLGWAQNITGNFNVGVGNSTGRTVSNGSYNVMLGHEAGYLNSQKDTVDHVILLGANTYSPVSNRMVLGDSTINSLILRGPTHNNITAQTVLTIDTTTGRVYHIPAVQLAGGGIKSNVTIVGNVGAGEDDLMTYTIPAGTLTTNGDFLEFEMSFVGAANGNNKTIKIYLAGNQILTVLNSTASSPVLIIRGTIMRYDATTATVSITNNTNGASPAVSVGQNSATWSGTVVLKATGEATSNNDIQQYQMTVKYFPAK